MSRILIIEDDAATAVEIATELRANGHTIEVVSDGQQALERAFLPVFDAITLDRMLPGLDGLALVELLRARAVATPILVISALSDVDDRIAGLRAGGDDYMVKPFASTEMAVRIEALLRRHAQRTETTLSAGGLELNLLTRQLRYHGTPVRLQPMELRLLELFMTNPARVLTRQVIFEKVWNYHFDPGANLVNVHVGRLRRKLEASGVSVAIVTVIGQGYRFDPEG